MSLNDPVDPVNTTGLYKPLTDTELENVSPMSIPGGLAYLAGLGLAIAGLALAPQSLASWLLAGGIAGLTVAYNTLMRRAKGLHKRVAALSASLRAALGARGYR